MKDRLLSIVFTIVLIAILTAAVEVARPARAEPSAGLQDRSALMWHVKELGHKALKLGYTCHEGGVALDQCAAEYDDVFDKAIAGEPL